MGNEEKSKKIQNIYELSPMQAGMFFHSLLAKDSRAYVEQYFMDIAGEIDVRLFEQSFNLLIERYDIFRTVFVHEKLNEPVQVVFKTRTYRMPYEDISHLSPQQIEKYFEEAKRSDRARGFDLTLGIPIRMSLFKTGDRSYKLIWTFHHIIMDGWCIGLVYRDWRSLYAGLASGQPVVLGAAGQYRDYIKWLQQQDKAAGLKYWQEYLRGYEQQAALPRCGDSTAAAGENYRSEEQQLFIDEATAGLLQEAARKNQVTPNMLFQVLWGILLVRYNNIADVVFGAVVSGRPPALPGVESIVGLFINTVPVRVKISPEATLSRLLRIQYEDGAAGKLYDYLPLAEIQAQTVLKNQLIDHIVGFENYPLQEQMTNAGSMQRLDFSITNMDHREQTNYDFNLIITPGVGFMVKFNYNGLVYKKDFIERAVLHFKQLVDQAAADSETRIRDIEIITPEEKKQLLDDFNNTRLDYPRGGTIAQLFEEQVVKSAGHVALHESFHAGFPGQISITYEKLNDETNRFARLSIQKGIKNGAVIGVMVERSIEMVAAVLGILKAGAAYLPIEPGYPMKRKRYMLADSAAQVLIARRSLAPKIEELNGLEIDTVIIEDHDPGTGNGAPGILCSPEDVAYIIYTSGTTGKPKGVVIEHSSLVNLCTWHNNNFAVTPADRAGQYANSAFDASVWEIFPYLAAGVTLHIIPDEIKHDIEQVNSFLERNNITICFLPTQFCEYFMKLENNSLRILLTGGDKLRVFIPKKYRLYNNYGPTENTVVAASWLVHEYRDNIPIGRPTANTRIYILSKDNLNMQPIGLGGELCIAGAGLARGYLNNPQLTAEKFMFNNRSNKSYMSYRTYFFNKIYRTGDLCRWLPDGSIEFLGRIDYQVKIRGFRIELAEIETQLLALPGLKEAVVIDREDASGQKYLCAYVAADKEQDNREIMTALANTLPPYMIPGFIMQLERIPLTPNGKVDRRALPIPGLQASKIYAPPTDEWEEKLVEIWSKTLNLEKEVIGIDDNFFELGGHSLKATIITAKIHEIFNIKIPLADIFKTPTIREIAALIKTIHLAANRETEQNRESEELIL